MTLGTRRDIVSGRPPRDRASVILMVSLVALTAKATADPRQGTTSLRSSSRTGKRWSPTGGPFIFVREKPRPATR